MAVKKLTFFSLAAAFVFSALLAVMGCGSGSSSTGSSGSAPSYKITIVAPTVGWGTVTSAPAGINCPPTCSASFAQNTQLQLTATPAANYSFNGWTGSCSGTTACTLTVSAPETANALFAPARNRSKVIAYVFTPDGIEVKSEEFVLMGNGRLQLLTNAVQPLTMTGTNYGLVAQVSNGTGAAADALQSYSVGQNGTLHAEGVPVAIAMDKSINLASDNSYVYAATDEGVFAFQDQTTGLTPLSPVVLTVPPPAPCTPQQENAGECRDSATIMLSNSSAFLLQAWYGQSGSSLYQVDSFSRSQGQLTAEQSFVENGMSTGIFAPTPDGNFVYALDLSSNRVFRYAIGGSGAYETNILSNGAQLSDGFVQFLFSPNGTFLYGLVSDAAESPRIRVFQVNPTSGDLSEVAGSPFLTGEYYLVRGALDPTGSFLLLAHANCDGSPPCLYPGRLVAMSINQTTGAMSVASDVEDGQYPYAVIAAPISQ